MTVLVEDDGDPRLAPVGVHDQLQAGKIELSEQRYGLIPVVSSTRIGELVAQDLDYRIRQVSSRYRNPKNAPDPFEAQVLDRFLDKPHLREHFAVTDQDGEPVFRYLRPFTADESCLVCHGKPEEAPAFIRRLFPQDQDQAYNYRIGEVIGAASVTIPMARLQAELERGLRNELITTGGIFLALVTCLGLLVRLAVTGPLGQFAAAMEKIARTGRFDQKLPRRGSDEVGTLIDGYNEMVDHLREKTRHLEESENRFRTLTETARDGIVSFLANGQIILFNGQAQRMFGYSQAEALGESVQKLVHPECASIHQGGVEDYLAENAQELTKKVQRIPARRRDGALFYVELSLSVAESDGHRFYTAILREVG